MSVVNDLRVLKHFGTENYIWKLGIFKYLYEFSLFFLCDFFPQKCFNTLKSYTTHYVKGWCIVCVCVWQSQIFWKKNYPKNWENGSKIVFFKNLLENLVINFFWIWSLMKVYIICCIPAQIRYLGKTIYFLKYRPKCSWPIRLQDF